VAPRRLDVCRGETVKIGRPSAEIGKSSSERFVTVMCFVFSGSVP
jgi:hypothetical protein